MVDESNPESLEADEEFKRVLRSLVNTPPEPHEKAKPKPPGRKLVEG